MASAEPHGTGSPEGLDLASLGRFLTERIGPASDERYSAVKLQGGRSNATYMVTWGDRDLVVRRPPVGPHNPKNHDVGREFRLISALEHTPLPTPAPVANEPTGEAIGVPFYVMDRVPGRVVMSAAEAPDLDDPAKLELLADALIDGLVALHSIDPSDVGLADLGRAEGYIARQTERWAGQWERQQQRSIPALDEIGRRLRAAVAGGGVQVDPERPFIIHGDYNVSNVLITPSEEFGSGPVLRAVLDWEMATLGHPFMDLGVLLAYSGRHAERVREMDLVVTSLPGFPREAELAERYGRASGRDTSDFAFFEVLAMYKVLVITEDVRARFLAGDNIGEGGELMGRSVPDIAEALLETARASSVTGLGG